jgi:peptidoglycan/LPS O-acetylase OafA/YrhL
MGNDGPTITTHDAGGRSAALDACRVVAAVLVIWTHATSGVVLHPELAHRTLGYFGVPFFTAAAVLFAVRQAFRGATVGSMFSARVRRIMVPFVVWAGVYWVLTDLVFGRLMSGKPLVWSWTEASKGFTWHLWFLPFVFVMGVGAGVAGWASARSERAAWVICVAALFSAGGLLHVAADDLLDPRRWPYELPVVLVTLAFAVALQRGWVRVARSAWVAGPLWAAVLGLAVYGLLEGEPPARRPAQAAGVLSLVACVATPDRWVPGWLSRLGTLGFGVYVAHLVLLQTLLRVLGRDGTVTPAEAVATFAATVVLTYAGVWLGKRTPVVRAVLP